MIDPAMEMIEDFRKKSKSTVVKGTPNDMDSSASHMHSPSRQEFSELESYLNKISLDDLMLLKKAPKSSKNLEGGPFISGKKVASGVQKKGYSVPQ
jgi:hypothetical protein